MGLFDRIFRQPPTHKASSDENLVTEILAYFLESLPGFRARFLVEGVGLSVADGDWEVTTQEALHLPGQPWHGKRPDLVLRRAAPATEVVVEVKIDAGVTVDGAGKPQTHFYESYLNHRRDTHGKETHLATLTRWTPDTSLCTAISRSIRFGQVVSWLVAAAREAPMSTAALAEDWARYLKKRRWAMMDISPDHLNALRAIIELKSHLRDVVEAATKAASLHDGSWYTKGRASESAFDEEGRVQWGPPLLHRHRGKHAKLQLGCHYGICQGEPCIRPVVWSSDDMVPRGQLSWPTKKFGEGWILVRDSIVALLGSQASNAIWDHMKSQLAECLAEVDRLIRESQPAKGRSGFLGLGKRGKE